MITSHSLMHLKLLQYHVLFNIKTKKREYDSISFINALKLWQYHVLFMSFYNIKTNKREYGKSYN